MAKEKGYAVSNISATIMAEKPKLLKIIPQITKNLSTALNIPESSVGIGATTLEGLGFVVTYEEETKTVLATNPETSDYFGMQADNTTYSFNGESVEFDVPLQKIGVLTFVPVRIIYELLGYEVSYDEATDTAIIK